MVDLSENPVAVDTEEDLLRAQKIISRTKDDLWICSCGNEFQSVRADFVYGSKEIHKFYECGKCDAIYLILH